MIVLYRNKETGEKITFDYYSQNLEYFDFKTKTKHTIPIQEVVKIIKNNVEEENIQEFELVRELSFFTRENCSDLKSLEKRISRLKPKIVDKGQRVMELSVRGILALVKKYAEKDRYNLTPAKIREVAARTLVFLEKRYFSRGDIPSFYSLSEVIWNFLKEEGRKQLAEKNQESRLKSQV